MKGNIKKLAVFVSIAWIFTLVTIASAHEPKGKKGLEGEYAATSVCYSLSSSSQDFLTTLVVSPGTAFNSFATSQTIWTFKSDGTGTVQGTQAGINPSVSASIAELSWQITYEITDDGTITTNFPPGTPGVATYTAGPLAGFKVKVDTLPQSGMVSQDHKTITLGTVTPVASTIKTYTPTGVLVSTIYGISSCGRVLTRLGEFDRDAKRH